MAESQRRLLEALQRKGGEATLAELETEVDLARETVRSHLSTLSSMGLISRSGVRKSTRGRPQVVYRLTQAGDSLFPRHEGALLAELARFLAVEDSSGLLDRFFATRREARRAGLVPRLAVLDDTGRLQEIARAMSEEGFVAEAQLTPGQPATLRLCHCPLAELVAASQLPCRAEKEMLEQLLGRVVERTQFRPHGDACCAYKVISGS